MTPNTLVNLQEFGYQYDSSFMDDDIPYLMKQRGHSVDLVQLPFSWQLDDAMYYSHSRHTPMEPFHVLDIWKEEFDFAYEETGYYMLCCHSRFSGRTVRARVLEELIQYIRGFDRVWFARCDEMARWLRKQS
jgi:peptidoglycan/xylan/chitin deacetylase (PgdA/CDA1 family)